MSEGRGGEGMNPSDTKAFLLTDVCAETETDAHDATIIPQRTSPHQASRDLVTPAVERVQQRARTWEKKKATGRVHVRPSLLTICRVDFGRVPLQFFFSLPSLSCLLCCVLFFVGWREVRFSSEPSDFSSG